MCLADSISVNFQLHFVVDIHMPAGRGIAGQFQVPFAIPKKRRGARDKDISSALLAGNVCLLPVPCSHEWPGHQRAGKVWIYFSGTVWTNNRLPAHLLEVTMMRADFVSQFRVALAAGDSENVESCQCWLATHAAH